MGAPATLVGVRPPADPTRLGVFQSARASLPLRSAADRRSGTLDAGQQCSAAGAQPGERLAALGACWRHTAQQRVKPPPS